MDSTQTSDSLSRALASWRVAAPRNPQFRTAVWARIGEGAVAQPWAVYARRHAAVVGGALTLAIAVGAFGGHGWARAQAAADSAQLATAYVQGLDARAMRMR
jgi:hypothetical protein